MTAVVLDEHRFEPSWPPEDWGTIVDRLVTSDPSSPVLVVFMMLGKSLAAAIVLLDAGPLGTRCLRTQIKPLLLFAMRAACSGLRSTP